MVGDWKKGASERKRKLLADLDEQIARLKECKQKIKTSDNGIGFKVYISLYDNKGSIELRWPDKPRDFFPLEYAIRQLEMSSGKTVRLRDDDSIVRILAGNLKY